MPRWVGGAHLFRELDQLFDDFLRGDRAVVIGVERLLEHLGELAALDEVSLRSHFDFVAQQLREQLGGDVLVFQSAHLGEEAVGEDADVGLLEPGRAEDVDDLAFGHDCFRDELPDGVIETLG